MVSNAVDRHGGSAGSRMNGVSGHFSGWMVLVFLLCGGVGTLLWQLKPWRAPHVRCPACGEDWEHDEFLSWPQCEKCGLRVERLDISLVAHISNGRIIPPVG